ncbi:MAG: hypothetical protein COB16_12880 [Rhodobacteraceae bacterium]|nr:MAG: hypothetical protein COB16_12880 [Paracoccaceae bacterium]
MRTSIAILLVTGLTLSGCSSWRASRVNPSNWFGSSQSAETLVDVSADQVNPLIPANTESGIFSRPDTSTEDFSVAIASVTELKVEKTPTGAIIYAIGLASRQGAYGVRLRRNEEADGQTLDYSFRALYPADPTLVGSETSRTLRVAVSLTHQDLAGIKLIRVSSDGNARETRR